MPDKSYSDLDAYPELDYSKEIKVLSWNLWWKFENYLDRQKLIFNELLILNPDILCLQEVWEDSDGSQAKKIADLFGYEYTYSKSFEIDGVSFGNAIISKFPILNSSSHKIPTAKEFNENRTLMHSVVNYDGFEIDISTYLSTQKEPYYLIFFFIPQLSSDRSKIFIRRMGIQISLISSD